jgi:hypothetical protein
MVTHFPQLHEYIHNTEEVRVLKDLLSLPMIDVLIIEQSLSSTEIALYNVLDFLRELFLHVFLHSS